VRASAAHTADVCKKNFQDDLHEFKTIVDITEWQLTASYCHEAIVRHVGYEALCSCKR
jgi:hypothetical protein